MVAGSSIGYKSSTRRHLAALAGAVLLISVESHHSANEMCKHGGSGQMALQAWCQKECSCARASRRTAAPALKHHKSFVSFGLTADNEVPFVSKSNTRMALAANLEKGNAAKAGEKELLARRVMPALNPSICSTAHINQMMKMVKAAVSKRETSSSCAMMYRPKMLNMVRIRRNSVTTANYSEP
eukprot:6461079-Amphidinium_carterae.1